MELHRDELIELLKVRGALDEFAAEEAALHGTKDGIARMAEMCASFRKAAETDIPDLGLLAERDVSFHVSIAECSGGELLPKLLRELNGLLSGVPEDHPRDAPVSAGISVKEHQAIVDAIVAGDARRARRAVSRHLAEIRLWIGGDCSKG